MKKIQRGIMLRLDRLLARKLFQQLGILLLLLLAAFLISLIFLSFSGAEWEAFCEKNDICKWLLPLYLLIDTNALNNLYLSQDGHAVHGWMLIASSITFLLGTFIFQGMIISVLTTTISSRVNEHREGLIHYLKSGHYIVMGFDDMVTSVISHIFEKDRQAYVLLLSSLDAIIIREKLRRTFDEKMMKKIIINYGHRTSVGCYKDIHLETAEQVYIVGLRGAPEHDAINVECVDSICKYLNDPAINTHPKRIVCVFEDMDTYSAFQTTEIFNEVRKLNIEFVPFNFFSGWAKQVFVKQFHRQLGNPQPIYYPSIYRDAVSRDKAKQVHLVFVGTSNFSVAFAVEAAHILHFPFFHKDKDKRRTRITFIDINADEEKDLFITNHRHFFEVQPYFYQDLSIPGSNPAWPSLRHDELLKFKWSDANFLDVEFEFIKGDIFSKAVQDKIAFWAEAQQEQVLSIFLAMADQRKNFAIGMNMPDVVYENQIRVFIRQDRSDNFVTNLRTAVSETMTYTHMDGSQPKEMERCPRYANIYPFGMTDTGYSADEESLWRAKLINYLYATASYDKCRFAGPLVLNSMTDEDLVLEADEHWKKLTVALKWSNLYNAYTIRVKVACLRAMRGLAPDDSSQDECALSDEELEEMARLEHNRWNVEKLLMGFRKASPEEDKYEEEKKGNDENAKKLERNKKLYIHHDIRPFDDLGDIKLLDGEFARYIPWLIKHRHGGISE